MTKSLRTLSTWRISRPRIKFSWSIKIGIRPQRILYYHQWRQYSTSKGITHLRARKINRRAKSKVKRPRLWGKVPPHSSTRWRYHPVACLLGTPRWSLQARTRLVPWCPTQTYLRQWRKKWNRLCSSSQKSANLVKRRCRSFNSNSTTARKTLR